MDPNSVPAATQSPQIPSTPAGVKNNNLAIVLGVITLILIFGLGGFFLGQNSVKKPVPVQTLTPVKSGAPKAEPFFDYQTASVIGKITAVSDTTISILNSKGQTKEFSVSPRLIISLLDPESKKATNSSQLKSLRIGQSATALFELRGNRYQVIGVNYYAITNLASPSALPNR